MALDDNDRHRNGTLPVNPEDDAEPFEPAPHPERRDPARVVALLDAKQLAKPLPELDYLIPDLGIASGAPVLFAGYGYSGKTVSLQSMALSIASDLPVWGIYGAKRGRVLHLDFEQGQRVTSDRYQRLARGMGFELAELGDRLKVAVNPEVYLQDADALDVYKRLFEGYDLVLLDSLRAAAPKADENSSEVRRYIDLANRAAEPHGAVVAIVHHARKPKADDPEGAKFKVRGSSALYDACGSLFIYEGAKDSPTRVSHEKCRNRGITIGDFGFRVEDVRLGDDPRAALRVTHLASEQFGGTLVPSAYPAVRKRIEEYLRSNSPFRGSRSALCENIHVNKGKFYAALSEMESVGSVEAGRDDQGSYVRWIDPGNSDGQRP